MYFNAKFFIGNLMFQKKTTNMTVDNQGLFNASEGYISLVQSLLSSGADINTRYRYGWVIPLLGRDRCMTEELINWKNNFGNTAMMEAV